VRASCGVFAALLLACRPPETKPPPAVVQQTVNDTVRGTFVVEGSDPFPVAVLRTSGGRVVVDGASAQLVKLSQLDLWLRGTRVSANRFHVTDYRVRGADGAAAWDGILRTGSNGFHLELEDNSKHEVRGAPSSFAALTGSRIWITESSDGAVRQYGVLQSDTR
jgi:hypothetical protein